MAKKKPIVIEDNVQASVAVMEIGKLWATISESSAFWNEEIIKALNEAREKAAKEVQPFMGSLIEQFTALKKFATKNREKLTADGARSIQVLGGSFGWRKLPTSISIEDSNGVVSALEALGLAKFVRVEKVPDKEALLKELEIARTIAGVKINEGGEKFFVKPEGVEEIAPDAAKKTIKDIGKIKKRKKT